MRSPGGCRKLTDHDSENTEISPETARINRKCMVLFLLYSMENKRILGSINCNLDEKDWIIIQLVQSNARISFAEMGRRTGLSPPAAAERLRSLEDAGVIFGYHAKISLNQ